ncbi:MAG: hypothetical protein ACRCY3_13265 [Sphingorhabdus sp.]
MSNTSESTLIAAATASAADLRLLADDVACFLFPRTGSLPSEELQASIRLALNLLVLGIEKELGAKPSSKMPQSWNLLCRSGLLREPALIDYCLARISERRIYERIADYSNPLQQLPARLLHDPNPLIAEPARHILIAENLLQSFDARGLMVQLPPELLHMLAWRIVAVLKAEMAPVGTDYFERACHALIARHDDADRLQVGAAKIVYFLTDRNRDDLDDPAKAGLPLFFAALSARTGLHADTLYRLADASSVEPLLIVLRACGFGVEDIHSLTRTLRGTQANDDLSSGLLDECASLDDAEAARICLSWVSEAGERGCG